MRWSDISFTSRTLRQFAALWIVFFLALAAWYGLAQGHRTLGVALAIAAVTIGPLGLINPRWIKPIYTVWMVAVFPIGWLVSLVLMAVVYYGVVTPIAVAFRLTGRDSLQRHSPPEADTCWRPKPMPQDPARYLRQY
jgi:hypothetical protein